MSETPHMPAPGNLHPDAAPPTDWAGIVAGLEDPGFVAPPAPSTIEEYQAAKEATQPGTDLVPYTGNQLGQPMGGTEIVDAEIVEDSATERKDTLPILDAEVLEDAEVVEPAIAPPAHPVDRAHVRRGARRMANEARQALALAQRTGRTVDQIAARLGIGPNDQDPPEDPPEASPGFIGPARPPVTYNPIRGMLRRKPYGVDPYTDLIDAPIPGNPDRKLPAPRDGHISSRHLPRALNPGGSLRDFYAQIPELADIPAIRNATTKGGPFWGVSRPERHGHGYQQMHWGGHHSHATRAQRLGVTLNPLTWFSRKGRRHMISPDNGDLRIDPATGKRVPPTGEERQSYIYR